MLIRNSLKLLIIFNLLIVFKVSGQTYHPLLTPNKYWEIFHVDFAYICGSSGGDQYFVSKDTLINGLIYKVISSHPINSYQGAFCPPFYVDSSVINLMVFMREDLSQKKVYYYNGGDNLIFDFSLSIGDTLYANGGQFVVDTITPFILNNGDSTKKFWLNNGGWYIEGIGGSNGLFSYPSNPMSIFEEYTCVQDSGVYLFSGINLLPFGSPGCLGTVGVNQNSFDNTFTISPNPTHDFCTVNSNAAEIKNIVVYDLTGKVLKKQTEKKIDLSVFANGIYFVEINLKNGKRSYSKIIKE